MWEGDRLDNSPADKQCSLKLLIVANLSEVLMPKKTQYKYKLFVFGRTQLLLVWKHLFGQLIL